MTRPKGSKNKATLAREAGAAAGGMGHNSGDIQGLDDNQRMALHHRHVNDYIAADKKRKDAQASFLNTCKIIKADGDSVSDVKRTIEIRKDPGAADKAMRSEIDNLMRLARWNALAIGTQTDIFSSDMRPLADRAEEEGRVAGMAGEQASPPYVEPEAHQRWLKGWHEGQAKEITDKIKPTGGNLIQADQNKGTEPDDFDKPGGAKDEDWPDEEQVKGRNAGEPAQQPV